MTIFVCDTYRRQRWTRYAHRLADVVVINKVDTGDLAAIPTVNNNIHCVNPQATTIEATSPIFVEEPEAIRGKNVLVIEDGPTLTRGEMVYGAGIVAAKRFGAAQIIDPRPYAVGSIVETFEQYPQTGPLLPAMDYDQKQIKELGETINNTPCDLAIVATPTDLRRVVEIRCPTQRVRHELQEIGQPTLKDVLQNLDRL